MKVLGTKVDNSEYDTFNSICNDCGISKSEQRRELVKDFNKFSGPDRNPTPKEPKPQVVFVDGDPRDYEIIKS